MVLQAKVKQVDMVAAAELALDRHGQFAARLQADKLSLGHGLKPLGLPNCDRSRTTTDSACRGVRKHA